MQRNSLHRIDNQISISNTWFKVDPGASFPSEQRNVRYSLGYPQELGFLESGNKGFVYLDVRPNKRYGARR